jgi:hypothetical protein
MERSQHYQQQWESKIHTRSEMRELGQVMNSWNWEADASHWKLNGLEQEYLTVNRKIARVEAGLPE